MPWSFPGLITGVVVPLVLRLDEVNQSVGQLDHVTQQNAALVGESAAAAGRGDGRRRRRRSG